MDAAARQRWRRARDADGDRPLSRRAGQARQWRPRGRVRRGDLAHRRAGRGRSTRRARGHRPVLRAADRLRAGLGARRPRARAAARARRDRPVDQRDGPLAPDPGRRRTTRSPSWRAPSTPCSTGSSRRVRQPARVRERRQARAAHADHHRPWAPRAARRRPARAARDGRAGHGRAGPHEPVRRRSAAAGQGRARATSCASDEVELGALTDELLDKAARPRRARWALEARGEARLRRRPPAAHPGRHGARAERRPAHRGR